MFQHLPSILLIFLLSKILSFRGHLIYLSEEEGAIRKSLAKCIATISEDNFLHDEIITVSLGPDLDVTRFSEATTFDKFLLPELFNKLKWSLILKQPMDGKEMVVPGGSKAIKGNWKNRGNYTRKISDFRYVSDTQYRKSDSYILQLRHWKEIDAHMSYLAKSKTWNAHAKFIVVSASVNVTMKQVEYIIKKLWKKDVLNGIVILPNLEDVKKLNIYSWFPFGDGFCGYPFNKVERIGTCKFGEMHEKIDLFPDKIPSKVNNCSIKVRTLEYPPFVVNPKRIGESNIYRINKGLDIQIMNMVSLATNMFMQYEIIDGDSWGDFGRNWGDFGRMLNNGSGGIVGALVRGDADIGIGSFAASSERHMWLDSSSAYFQDSLGFCVPHSAEKSHFQKLSGIMTLGVWIALTLTMIIYVVLATTLSGVHNQEERNIYTEYGSVTMKILAIGIAQSINIQPSSSKVRLFLLLWIIFSLHLDTAYQTYLMSTLTNVDYAAQINTVEEILDSNLTILFRPADRRYYNALRENISSQAEEIMSRAIDCDNLDECLRRTAFQKDSVIAASRLYIQYAKNSYISKTGLPLLYCLEEQIVTYPLVSYMRVGFPLLNRIDDLISRINSAGYIQYFEEEIFKAEKLAAHFGNDTVEDIDKEKKQLLKFEHMTPMFIFLLIGYSFGIFVFFLEYLCFKGKIYL